MYSSTTYSHGLGGYSRTVLSPARTYTTTHLGGPVATTTYGGLYGDAVVSHHGGLYGSTVTRTFSPGRSYTTSHIGAPLLGATVYDAPLATSYVGGLGPYGYSSVIASPGRTTTTYGPFGATTRTVNYF
jgi:hypothetical protein